MLISPNVKMKKIFCIFFFAVIFSALVSSAEFSPNILVYSLEPNQELCQQIIIFSETLKKFEVSDGLSENSRIEINFTKTIDRFKGEKIIDICIKGNQNGIYNGMVFFRDPAEKNTSLFAGSVQIFVDVSEIQQSPSEIISSPSASSGGGGGGGGGGGSSAKPKTTANKNQTIANKTIQSLSVQTKEISNSNNESPHDASEITGAAVSTNSKLKPIIPIIFILAVLVFFVYSKINPSGKNPSSPKKRSNTHLNKSSSIKLIERRLKKR